MWEIFKIIPHYCLRCLYMLYCPLFGSVLKRFFSPFFSWIISKQQIVTVYWTVLCCAVLYWRLQSRSLLSLRLQFSVCVKSRAGWEGWMFCVWGDSPEFLWPGRRREELGDWTPHWLDHIRGKKVKLSISSPELCINNWTNLRVLTSQDECH